MFSTENSKKKFNGKLQSIVEHGKIFIFPLKTFSSQYLSLEVKLHLDPRSNTSASPKRRFVHPQNLKSIQVHGS